MVIEAKVIADSVYNDSRLTTLELTMHRFVLAEFNTHRVFSRNSASSRAIPIHKTMDKVIHNPAWPILWNSEKPGMQGGEKLENQALWEAQSLFEDIRDNTVNKIQSYLAACEHGELDKLHKAYLNRLLEPFLWHKVIVSATEWDNFFEQRDSELALPEFASVAREIKYALNKSVPVELITNEWHLPYSDDVPRNSLYSYSEYIEISAARCARVSYETHDGVRDIEKDLELAAKLMSAKPMHYSPFEHQAQAHANVTIGANFGTNWVQARWLLENEGSL